MMFKKSFPQKDRVNKIKKPSKRSFRDDAKQKLREQLALAQSPPTVGSPQLNRDLVKIAIGKDRRMFAAHEDVLCKSPVLQDLCENDFVPTEDGKRIALVDEDPETFSAVLEYLYRDDYYPRLLHDRKRNTWCLEDDEDAPSPNPEGSRLSTASFQSATIFIRRTGESILRDTIVYCAAGKYALPDLKRLALRKQGLRSGLDVRLILRSARYTYDNTPADDGRLRAHYLALIVRGRRTFKRSEAMAKEMETGSRLFFDLFVAMCEHMDDLSVRGTIGSPATI